MKGWIFSSISSITSFPARLKPGRERRSEVGAFDLGRAQRALPEGGARERARAGGKRAAFDCPDGGRHVLSQHLGGGADGARAAHLVSGARQRRQQRRVLRARHHRGRSRAFESVVRALFERRAQRAAGHRHRFRARAARRSDSSHLRAPWPRSRGHGLGGDLLSRQERAARSGQSVRLVFGADRSTERDDHALGYGRGEPAALARNGLR